VGHLKRVKGHQYLCDRDGSLYFRRGIPEDVRHAFGGKREVVVSLDTRSLAEARHRAADQLRLFDQKLAAARGTSDPTRTVPAGEDAHTAARTPERDEIERSVREWLAERLNDQILFAGRASEEDVDERASDLSNQHLLAEIKLARGSAASTLSTEWVADTIAAAKGWKFAEGSRLYAHLVRTLIRAEREAAHRTLADLDGSPITELDATFASERYRLDAETARAAPAKSKFRPQSITGLLEGRHDERKLAPATLKAWKRHLKRFIAFVGHDDAHRVTADDVVRWKEHLRTRTTREGTPLSIKTINESYLAGLKAAYAWGVGNRRVESNPAAGITVIGKPPPRRRDKHLLDHEALTILRATLAPPGARLTPQHAFARRWVPWLCAFTGARVNEMTQLRAEDVVEVSGLWSVHITPDAGGQKRHEAWHVPLHSQIIEQGFLKAVAGKRGPLFYDPSLYRGGSEGNPQYKKTGERLAAWVRSLGVTRNVDPNHGWRHRFMTLVYRHGLDARIADQIEGHAPATDGEAYGEAEVVAMKREIEKLPRYPV
jgi:integrase